MLILSRRHFPVDRLQQLVAATRTSLQFSNDIYSKVHAYSRMVQAQ